MHQKDTETRYNSIYVCTCTVVQSFTDRDKQIQTLHLPILFRWRSEIVIKMEKVDGKFYFC